MLGDLLPAALVGCILVIILTRLGGPLRIFNAIKEGLVLFAGWWLEGIKKLNKPIGPKRTAIQKKFNSDLNWPQTRWAIARTEHELYPDDPGQWSHDVADCVMPACNPKALRVMRDGQMMELPPSPDWNHGRVARPVSNPIPGNPQKH